MWEDAYLKMLKIWLWLPPTKIVFPQNLLQHILGLEMPHFMQIYGQISHTFLTKDADVLQLAIM